jgi:glycosyltransferase involved in cell wall biosynthesis
VTVLYFADTRFPIERANGVQTMATCVALAERGHAVRLAVRPDTAATPRDPYSFYDQPHVPTLEISTIPGASDPRARRARFLISAVRLVSTNPDAIVFTRDLGLAAFLLQVPLLRRARVVYESHGLAPVVSAEMPRLLGHAHLAPSAAKIRRLDRRERRVWAHARAYVTLTRALADELVERYGPRDHVFVVPDGAHEAPALPGAAPGQSEFVSVPTHAPGPAGPLVVYAGHLYPWKGVDVLLSALAQVPLARGLIVGGHPAEADQGRIVARVADLRLIDRVTMTGLVPPADVRGHLERASILVLPNTASAISERYTSPLKLFEYLTIGRPIVASDLPAIREVLTNEETALLARAGDAGALAAAIRRLMADPVLATRLGQAARALAPSYSWARRAERLEEALAVAGA